MRFLPSQQTWPPLVRVSAAACLLIATGGCGGDSTTAPAAARGPYDTPLAIQPASYNPFVGSYTGTGTLINGRTVTYELSVAPYATFTLRYATDAGAGAGGMNGTFGVATGEVLSQNGSVPISADSTYIGFSTYLPKNSIGGVGISMSNRSGVNKNEVVTFRRVSAPVLGTFGFARVVDPSTDCNAVGATTAFARVFTKYLIPGAKAGDFYAEGELTNEASSTHGFNFFLSDLNRTDAVEQVGVGRRTEFPNPKAQFNYFERTPDGKIRVWSAVSGALVFDAVEKFGVDVSIGGDVFKPGSAVTFHLDNVRMQARADNPQDPRFAGARGSFTLSFSGSSTQALEKISR